MSERTLLPEWLWPRDGRSAREVEANVREELQSHFDRLIEEQIRGGVPEAEARRLTAAQFGDIERYAKECCRIDLRERLMVRRALVVACVLLIATCAYLVSRVFAAQQTAEQLREDLAAALLAAQQNDGLVAQLKKEQDDKEADREVAPVTEADWVQRLTGLREHMQTAFAAGPELTLLPPDEGVAIVREAWPKLTIREVKTGLLKTFAFSKALAPKKHRQLFAVLDLGMRDEDPEVRSYAATYLTEYAYDDMSGDLDAYDSWFKKYGAMTPEEAKAAAANEAPESLKKKLAVLVQAFRDGKSLELFGPAGEIGHSGHPYAIPTLIGLIEADNSYNTVYGIGYYGLGPLTDVNYSRMHDGAWWRRWWERNKTRFPDAVQKQPIPEFPLTAFAKDYVPFPEALDTLDGKLEYFEQGIREGRLDVTDWARDVASHDDPKAIPYLIGAIIADESGKAVHNVGSYALADLTGVNYAASHDGAWWRAWWEKNKSRYPADVQAIAIPDYKAALRDAENKKSSAAGAGWQLLDAVGRALR
jgi:hypothetical protein